jgi:hypothetical protein
MTQHVWKLGDRAMVTLVERHSDTPRLWGLEHGTVLTANLQPLPREITPEEQALIDVADAYPTVLDGGGGLRAAARALAKSRRPPDPVTVGAKVFRECHGTIEERVQAALTAALAAHAKASGS